jgi:glycosyltransferase involved in cell wall biosynthesis
MAETVVVLETRVVCGEGGGPDKTILNSLQFLTGADYRTICAYMHPPEDPGFAQLRAKARAWGAPLLSVCDPGPWDLQVIPRLLGICRRERVAIRHGHDYKSNALGLLLRRFWPMRLVTTVHGGVKWTRRTPLYYKIDELCLPHYEAVICVSADLRERCLARKVSPQRGLLIENAIDTEEYSRKRAVAKAKRSLDVRAGRSVIGTVGRLSAEKGFDLLIQAVAGIVKDGLDVELRVVGEGDEKAALQALADRLGIGDRVLLLGYRADTRSVYEALDLFVLSSLREGLPNGLLEAMAMEVPVIATRIAGIPRLLEDERTGLLVEPGSVPELTQALRRFLRDSKLRDGFRRAGRRRIDERYGFAARMRKVRALYDTLLGRATSSGACRSSEAKAAS